MQKNITFNAEEKLIEQAREKAMKNKTTLNELFRIWLKGYVRDIRLQEELDGFLSSTSYAESGRSFSRDEFNER
jgi:hypothetical protein